MLKISAENITTLKAEWVDVVTCGECVYRPHCNFGIAEHGLDNFCSLGTRRKENEYAKDINAI